jgi:dTDP-3-amino-2,3,6-trideoxy-4-keto-D-glucose/dTDP-3-amino-3,4,6-trideoxy-alpha-D-glucose/dTDP-2,6-dideoxy-D-kanosamine transaminase
MRPWRFLRDSATGRVWRVGDVVLRPLSGARSGLAGRAAAGLGAIPVNDLSRSWIATAPEVREILDRVLSGGRYVQGPEHDAFERELAALLGVRHVAGVASGTDALVLSLLAVGCGPGSEVVVAANAGGYAALAVAQIGARTVYADVAAPALLLTAETITRVVGPTTAAVVVTHLYGNAADVASIIDVARPRGIAVIEDCAQAIGAVDRSGRRVGSLGDAAAFSFYPTKNLGAAGDGGAVATGDDMIADAVRSLRQYGWTTRYTVGRALGRNSRLDELQAAILRLGLRQLDSLNARRRAIVDRYHQSMPEGLELVTGAGCPTVAHLAVVRTPDRERLRARLDALGVRTDVHYPIADHEQPGLAPPLRSTELAETERATREVLTLPCFPGMTDEEVERVCAALAAGPRDS